VPAALWLGDLHYRAGRLEQAISICDAALERAPRNRELRDRLVNWTKEHELQSRFHEVRTSRFIVLFEAIADEPLARRVLEQLETAYARIANTLGLYPSEPITALIYSRQQFDDITRLASWSAAGYDGRIRVPRSVAVSERDELDRVLSHEFVHALVDMTAGRSVPAWLNEGLATALEPTGPTSADATPSQRARLALSQLHRGFVLLSRRDAEAAYASSAQAVRRLLDQHGAGTITALLGDLRRGVPFASAFEYRLAMRYEDFAALVAGSNP
jgi:tetratricopeptide (TPR) repeat protein